MRARSTLLAVLLCALAFGLMAPTASAARAGFIPVNPQVLSNGGTLTAVKITNVTSTGTGLVASGLAVVNTATGTIIAPFTNTPLAASGNCPILHLVLGPINLNLLGLQVTTNQIVLDITAIPGPGNLLGNLLCAVTHLLDQNPLNLNQIATLLNQILAAL
jgi:hypothetical protein